MRLWLILYYDPCPMEQSSGWIDLAAHAWRLVLALGLLLAVRVLRPRPGSSPDARRLLMLFVGALALRMVFGIWGPFHHNGHGTEWVRAALYSEGYWSFYGPGFSEVFGPFATLWPRFPDMPVFIVNVVASSLVPVFVYGIARQLFEDRDRPWLAGLLMMADPFAVRYAASEAYFTPIMALTSGAALALMKASFSKREGWRDSRWLLAVAGGLLAAQASRIHPVAWIPAGLAWAAGLAAWRIKGAKFRDMLILVAVASAVFLLAAFPAIMESFFQIIKPRSPNAVPLPFHAFELDHWWEGLIAVSFAAVFLYWRIGLRHPALPLGLAAAAVMVVTRDTYDMSVLFRAGYDRIFFPFLLPALTLVAARWLRATRAPTLYAALAAAITLAWYWPGLVTRNTEQLEYGVVRSWLADLPGECLLATPDPNRGPVLDIPSYITSDGAYDKRQLRKVRTAGELEALASEKQTCKFYLRTSLCNLRMVAGTCRPFEQVPGMREVARATLPARSSTRCWDYEKNTVDIVLFRLPGGHDDAAPVTRKP